MSAVVANVFDIPIVDFDKAGVGVIYVKDLIKYGNLISKFFDAFGTSVKMVRNDVEGNMRKINDSVKCINENIDTATIKMILEAEEKMGISKRDPSGCVGILWLKRAMDFTIYLIKLMLNDTVPELTMNSYIRKSYDKTLSKYHNWIVKKTFTGVISLTSTNTVDCIRRMSTDPNLTTEETFKNIREAMKQMGLLLQPTHKLLVEFNHEVEIDESIYCI